MNSGWEELVHKVRQAIDAEISRQETAMDFPKQPLAHHLFDRVLIAEAAVKAILTAGDRP